MYVPILVPHKRSYREYIKRGYFEAEDFHQRKLNFLLTMRGIIKRSFQNSHNVILYLFCSHNVMVVQVFYEDLSYMSYTTSASFEVRFIFIKIYAIVNNAEKYHEKRLSVGFLSDAKQCCHLSLTGSNWNVKMAVDTNMRARHNKFCCYIVRDFISMSTRPNFQFGTETTSFS